MKKSAYSGNYLNFYFNLITLFSLSISLKNSTSLFTILSSCRPFLLDGGTINDGGKHNSNFMIYLINAFSEMANFTLATQYL